MNTISRNDPTHLPILWLHIVNKDHDQEKMDHRLPAPRCDNDQDAVNATGNTIDTALETSIQCFLSRCKSI